MATANVVKNSTLLGEEHENLNKNSSASARKQGTDRKSIFSKWLRKSTRRLGFGNKNERRDSVAKDDKLASSELNLQQGGSTTINSRDKVSKAVDTEELQHYLMHEGGDAISDSNVRAYNSPGRKYVNDCNTNESNSRCYQNGGKSLKSADSEEYEYNRRNNKLNPYNDFLAHSTQPYAANKQSMLVEVNHQEKSPELEKLSKDRTTEVKLDSVDAKTHQSNGDVVNSLSFKHEAEELKKAKENVPPSVERLGYPPGDWVVMERKQFDELISELSLYKLRLNELQHILEDGMMNENVIQEESCTQNAHTLEQQVYNIPVLHLHTNSKELNQSVTSRSS